MQDVFVLIFVCEEVFISLVEPFEIDHGDSFLEDSLRILISDGNFNLLVLDLCYLRHEVADLVSVDDDTILERSQTLMHVIKGAGSLVVLLD